MDNDQIIAEQSAWHAKTLQGCIFAAYLFQKLPKESNIHRISLNEPISKDLILKISELITEHINRIDSFLISIILPQIIKKEHLIEFIELSQQNTSWVIDNSELWGDLKLVKIRVPLNEKNEKGEMIFAWMLGFGKLDFFPKTRQSPYFEIIVPTKSKYFYKNNFNKYSLTQHTPGSKDRGVKDIEAHLADVYIKGITDDDYMDNSLWDSTSKRKYKILTESGTLPFNDTNAKAKITFSYPVK